LVLVVFGLIDLFFMARLAPVLRLGPRWLFGEALGLVFCLLPSFLLARWTAENKNLPGRVTLQFFAFTALSMGLLPAMVLEASGGSWKLLWLRSPVSFSIWVQALAVPAIFGLSALQEFAKRGCGTPFPYDPPQMLVTSGVYSYIANPMQASSTVLMIALACMLHSIWVVALGAIMAIYSLGIASWDEATDLVPRFGDHWIEYRRQVRPWRLRWKPWADPRRSSRMYVSQTCSRCAEVSHWFAARKMTGVTRVAAEEHPDRDLRRITYNPGDGTGEEQGVAAIARGLEHINLCWAFLGFAMRLPVVRPLLQLLIDVSGGEERLIARGRILPS
jgi:protein-S-isoprenylcysteine O-methyltransferase Ste14